MNVYARSKTFVVVWYFGCVPAVQLLQIIRHVKCSCSLLVLADAKFNPELISLFLFNQCRVVRPIVPLWRRTASKGKGEDQRPLTKQHWMLNSDFAACPFQVLS